MYSFSCLPAAHDDSPEKLARKAVVYKTYDFGGFIFSLLFHYFGLFMRFYRMLVAQFKAHKNTHTEPILINCFVQNEHKKFSYTFMI